MFPLPPSRRAIPFLKSVAAVLVAGMAGCAGYDAGRLSPAETVMSATCLLASEKAVGTGFLVAVPDPSAAGEFLPVVVTSTHLLKTGGRRGIAIPLRLVDAQGRLLLAMTQAAPASKNAPWYVAHPVLDVAAFELRLPENLPAPSYLPFVEKKNLEAVRPRAGESIFFAGYPEGVPASEGMFPVLRAATVASLDQNIFDLPYFLINGSVHPGDSGAPVFRSVRGGPPKIVGMVTQRLGTSARPMPLGLAIDAGAIRETLELFLQKRPR
jgi:hypothetical protein